MLVLPLCVWVLNRLTLSTMTNSEVSGMCARLNRGVLETLMVPEKSFVGVLIFFHPVYSLLMMMFKSAQPMSSNCQLKMALMKPKCTNNNKETAATECKTGPCVFVGRYLAWICQHMFEQRLHTSGCFFIFMV